MIGQCPNCGRTLIPREYHNNSKVYYYCISCHSKYQLMLKKVNK